MVVLAVGVQPNPEAGRLLQDGALALDDRYYVGEADEDLDPGRTNLPGVFVAGSGRRAGRHPRLDPPHGRARSHRPSLHLERAKVSEVGEDEGDVMSGGRKIGVYVCQCGGNIGSYVDVDKVVDEIKGDDDVVVARSAMFTCRSTRRRSAGGEHRGRDSTPSSSPRARPSCTPSPSVMSQSGPASTPFPVYTQVNVHGSAPGTSTPTTSSVRPRRPFGSSAPASTARASRAARADGRRRREEPRRRRRHRRPSCGPGLAEIGLPSSS